MPVREAFFANISLEAEESNEKDGNSEDLDDGDLPWNTFIEKTNAQFYSENTVVNAKSRLIAANVSKYFE